MSDCKSCKGNCGGCKKELVLSQGEIDLLKALGQFSFLPVARKANDMTPIYLEDDAYSREEYSVIIWLLEQKYLIHLDYTPLSGAKMGHYAGYPVHGSMALTERGQQVLELLELQGAEE